MSSSCKMHERLWIDTGPLISLHRQLPRSGVEPTPMAATAAAQFRGQRERATRVTHTWSVEKKKKYCQISSKQHCYVDCVCSLCFFQTLKTVLAKPVLTRVERKRIPEDKKRKSSLEVCLAMEAIIITHSFFFPK